MSSEALDMSVVHAVYNEHSSTECISDWGRSDGKVNGQVYQQIHEPRPAMISALLTTSSVFSACKIVVYQSAGGTCKQIVESRAVLLQHHVAYHFVLESSQAHSMVFDLLPCTCYMLVLLAFANSVGLSYVETQLVHNAM